MIKEYADYIDYWVSEPDKGIYNAMNKGVKVAHGDYCQFLNSGDWLYDIDVLHSFLLLNEDADIILGKTAHIFCDRVKIGRSVDNNITFLDLYTGGINHQSSFIKTDLCREFPYDENYKICSDWKFFIQTIILNNCSFLVIDDIIVNFDMAGISNINTVLNGKERIEIIRSLGIPPRILNNYEVLDRETYKIALMLHPYQGLKKLIGKCIERTVAIYKKIK